MEVQKMNKYKSVIWSVSKEEFQKIMDTSFTITDFLKGFGLNARSGNHRTLYRRIEKENISLVKFVENKKEWRKKHLKTLGIKNRIDNKNIFIENSTTERSIVKRRIIQEKIIPYKCLFCGNIGEHNGETLSLQLDHINGINNDNRIENLRFLCPNCHSQTANYSGKTKKGKNGIFDALPEKDIVIEALKTNKIGEASKVLKVSISTVRRAISYYGIEYKRKNKSFEDFEKVRKFNCDKEELEKLISENSMVFVGKKFGVSDNAIKKRCKFLGIDLSKRKNKHKDSI
jgi:5-methylcytosine-specific restriction endonuclease McrA